MGFTKPRPRPAKGQPAAETLSAIEREALAKDARYVGSPHHTNVPKFGIKKAAPRSGAMGIEQAEAEKIKNPDCLICPSKWIHRHKDVTKLLQNALTAGTYVTDGPGIMPVRLWVRDPEEDIVYEAKLCEPPKGYKAYPLTSYQVAYNLPFVLP
ncbi:hypothetical protein [Novosphingobium sp. Fuku2-ISO-50]|uniref:hypothetical protein n=1 Tax=Novosphingobium sp. Fuku2-ISO-50 TaxID=1739114 RepID=UPI0012E3D542|nr:hypothetical protein [Novosphingobium sp. Fuku2-ISO-50]